MELKSKLEEVVSGKPDIRELESKRCAEGVVSHFES